jgi:hypothetical protein
MTANFRVRCTVKYLSNARHVRAPVLSSMSRVSCDQARPDRSAGSRRAAAAWYRGNVADSPCLCARPRRAATGIYDARKTARRRRWSIGCPTCPTCCLLRQFAGKPANRRASLKAASVVNNSGGSITGSGTSTFTGSVTNSSSGKIAVTGGTLDTDRPGLWRRRQEGARGHRPARQRHRQFGEQWQARSERPVDPPDPDPADPLSRHHEAPAAAPGCSGPSPRPVRAPGARSSFAQRGVQRSAGRLSRASRRQGFMREICGVGVFSSWPAAGLSILRGL